MELADANKILEWAHIHNFLKYDNIESQNIFSRFIS